MTELLFQMESYIREFEARVTGIDADQHAVSLDRTAFYPGGGGQPADRGRLDIDGTAIPVTTVRKAGADVLHVLEGAELPAVGSLVRGAIDWDWRYALMRTHTAMHILCGVVWRDYGASVTGGNMEPLRGRMDFEFERFDQELVREIEEKINIEVAANRPVRVRILPRDEAFQIPDLIRTKVNLLPEGILEIRTVEIVGLDLQADGGTHVASTAEVGRIRITETKNKGGIFKRIYVALDDQA